MPGRSYAVLGEMAELGDAHRPPNTSGSGGWRPNLGSTHVVTVGFGPRSRGGQRWGLNVESPGEALDSVRECVRDGDVVLVKASRIGRSRERLADRLTEEARR